MLKAILGLLALAAGVEAAHADSGATYHADAQRSGRYTMPNLTPAVAATAHIDTGFSGTVTGAVYAQPLFWQPAGSADGAVIVATESNVVAALDGVTGATLWQTTLGTPVPAGTLECGDISPLGVTGTPVIDPAAGVVYLDAMIAASNGPQHEVFGVSLTTGKVLPGWPVVVRKALKARGHDFRPEYQNQRGALALVGGRVYVGYGGLSGDCGNYHGWVVGVDPKGPAVTGAWDTSARGGAVWGQGGVVSDGAEIFVATGNTIGATSWGDGEAVIRLTPTLNRSSNPVTYFAPANWQSLDNGDLDIGSSAPVPLDITGPTGLAKLMLAMGKDGNAYLLNRTNLGGIGGALLVQKVSPGQIKTAPAVYQEGGNTYVAYQGTGSGCPSASISGLTTLEITMAAAPVVTTVWCASLNGGGAPIVTTTDGTNGAIVWAVGAGGDNLLHGWDGSAGAVVFAGGGTAGTMTGLHHFQSLLAANGRLYVGADGRIYSFVFGS
jgi:hypothetical protein